MRVIGFMDEPPKKKQKLGLEEISVDTKCSIENDDTTHNIIQRDEDDNSSSEEDNISQRQLLLMWLERCKEVGADAKELLGALDKGYEDIVSVLQKNQIDVYSFISTILESEEDPFLVLEQVKLQCQDILYHRHKLDHINTKEDVVMLIKNAKKIIVISGAGISVSCGIPDFRSPGGLYDQINQKFDLKDPHLLFDINYLKKNPVPFFEFAKQLFPKKEQCPSTSHKFIKALEDQNKLLRHYTQNIDMLEKVCGIENSVQCHGSFEKATCITCNTTLLGSQIHDQIITQGVPYCQVCNDGKSFMKPNIVFFGEPLSPQFHSIIKKDCKNCDLLLVMGSSLHVNPVASIPKYIAKIDPSVPQVLVNNEQVGQPHEWDYFFQGDCDTTAHYLTQMIDRKFTKNTQNDPEGGSWKEISGDFPDDLDKNGGD